MDIPHLQYVRDDDVCEQLCGRRTPFLVLGLIRLVLLVGPETVGRLILHPGAQLIAYRFRIPERTRFSTSVLSLSLLTALRIVRGWNQTGQKHAGEPDIAKTFLPAHNLVLWILVGMTYIDIIQHLARYAMPWASRQLSSTMALTLGIAGVGFKINFTKADAPELLYSLNLPLWRALEKTTLVFQARTVFICIIILTALTALPTTYQRRTQATIVIGSTPLPSPNHRANSNS